MSVITTVESLVIPEWLKLALKLLPYAVIISIAGALFVTRATLHDVRLNDKVVAAQNVAAQAVQEKANATAQQHAAESYAEKLNAKQPIVLHNKEIVHDYANTPAGAAPCLSTDRVSGINSTRSELFPSAPAGDNAVHTDPSP